MASSAEIPALIDIEHTPNFLKKKPIQIVMFCTIDSHLLECDNPQRLVFLVTSMCRSINLYQQRIARHCGHTHHPGIDVLLITKPSSVLCIPGKPIAFIRHDPKRPQGCIHHACH